MDARGHGRHRAKATAVVVPTALISRAQAGGDTVSLLGRDTAFVVIGISCQPALQLHLNREHVSSLVGEPMAYKSSFFNWLMFSVDEVPSLLERMVGGPI